MLSGQENSVRLRSSNSLKAIHPAISEKPPWTTTSIPDSSREETPSVPRNLSGEVSEPHMNPTLRIEDSLATPDAAHSMYPRPTSGAVPFLIPSTCSRSNTSGAHTFGRSALSGVRAASPNESSSSGCPTNCWDFHTRRSSGSLGSVSNQMPTCPAGCSIRPSSVVTGTSTGVSGSTEDAAATSSTSESSPPSEEHPPAASNTPTSGAATSGFHLPLRLPQSLRPERPDT